MKMRTTVKKTVEVKAKTIAVNASVMYWEDAEVDGVEDIEGTLIPCREGDSWCPIIDIDSGVITNWRQGITADIYYKVCDAGIYTLKDADGNVIAEKDGYVPNFMSPSGGSYGDYIIMKVGADGRIEGWNADLSAFEKDDEE